MIMVLLDEPTLILFESPDKPPDRLEAVDVMNGEYSFCDEDGQMYEGVLTDPGGWFRPAEYGLRPVGPPDIANALALVELAVMIEPNPWFSDLKKLRAYLGRSRSGRIE
jgi:hypothetical protein